MSDKILKFLRKLSIKERDQVELAIMRLRAGDVEGLNIKRLVGMDDTFRLRAGRIRVVYTGQGLDVRVIKIAFRDDATYKGL
jgi:mRNA-degrading endonuclease RelE of RelBE toxin-antitoxin system